jgi:peroxiredoxin Q/BCP
MLAESRMGCDTVHMKWMLLTAIAALLLPACFTASSSLRLVEPGMPAPSFQAQDQDGAVRTLAEFRGRPLVIFFYPKDGSPGCTKEACAFRDAWTRYEERGIAIVGVSKDDSASHKAFAVEHRLPFPLLADEDGAVARAYGVDSTFGLMDRVTVLVDEQGVVKMTWPNVDPGVHATQILNAAASTGPPSP